MKIIKTAEYTDFLRAIKNRITEAQISALKSVNKELVILYWHIGKEIVEKQKTEQWGDAVID